MLEWGPGKPSATAASVNMTMAFAIVSFSAVNIGLVMRRERQVPWASPAFPREVIDHAVRDAFWGGRKRRETRP